MEMCDKCGKGIKLKCAFERPSHLFDGEFYCSECREEVSEEFCMGD